LGKIFFLFFSYNQKEPTPVFIFQKPRKSLRVNCLVKKESSRPAKNKNQLRVVEPKDYVLMNPSGGGVLSKTGQTKSVEDLIKPKS
jgi:hypothetical protein